MLLNDDRRILGLTNNLLKQLRWDVASENLNSKKEFFRAVFDELKDTSISNLQVVVLRKLSPRTIKSLAAALGSIAIQIPLLAPVDENRRDCM